MQNTEITKEKKIDIKKRKLKKKNIHVLEGSQSDPKFINSLINKYKKFDIIIDDGSHKLEDILICLSLLFDRLKSKGVYVIEDFMHPNYFKHLDSVNEPKIDQLIKYR